MGRSGRCATGIQAGGQDLHTGRKPAEDTTGSETTVADACNVLLTSKELAVQAGELSQRQFNDLKRAAKRLVKQFGRGRLVDDLRPDDLRERAAMAKRYKTPSSMRREIGNIRHIFIKRTDRPACPMGRRIQDAS